ncbi:MAG: polysaccharide pyruvyl transferase family protein [Candidatus Peribacteraceae bacterium]|nr:polysaccharide pyruvyl transferase family protein [Candidatus Peribacteraceae bacterium]
MRTFLLVGNYGVGNLGDEALKDYFLRAFPDVRWRVVSAHPAQGELPRLPAGFRSLFTPWWRTLAALYSAQGMVFGGGTLFTDIESVRACFLWWVHACAACLFRKPVVLAFQGVGPFRTKIGEWLARRVCRRAAFISVRDEASRMRLESWKLNKNVIQSFDPVVLLLQSAQRLESAQNVFVIIPRNTADVSFLDRATRETEKRAPHDIVVLSLKPGDRTEQTWMRRIVSVLGGRARVVAARSLTDVVREVSRASFVLSQRYHGALIARVLDREVEVIPQGAGDKLEALPSAADMPSCISLAREGEARLRSFLLR